MATVVNAQTIHAELHRLRELQSEGGGPGTVAATSTLVAYAARPSAWERIAEAARRIAIAHAARLLLLDAAGHASPHVTSFCGREGSETICCEEVTIPLEAGSPDSSLALVEELLLPGLPAHLWWNGAGIDGRLFAGLRALVKRIVVDSSQADADAGGLVELERALERRPHAHLSDLAWLRVGPWREMAARLFDDPEHAARLAHLEAIEIVSGTRGEAALLAGWLGVQLGFDVPAGSGAFATPAGGRVTFAYARGGEPGEVRSVRLRTAGMAFTAAVESGGTSVSLSRESGRETRTRCEPLVTHSPEDRVSKALYGPDSDPAFAPSLAMAARLVSA
ncbi:MAG TPA: glucose-6-phosphate dehydrogenase assembly protein OpcA [Candidatus Dormibacteraeota bacterium]|nr:glucose-6-phosphate dehydrogenase assembly protein OpcA [Candidatus Dormibacteraeota bacterium]